MELEDKDTSSGSHMRTYRRNHRQVEHRGPWDCSVEGLVRRA